jgi:hypothetical protein
VRYKETGRKSIKKETKGWKDAEKYSKIKDHKKRNEGRKNHKWRPKARRDERKRKPKTDVKTECGEKNKMRKRRKKLRK